ncbi:MAG: hypothetical protein WAN47_03030 [Nitrosotalea sp.]
MDTIKKEEKKDMDSANTIDNHNEESSLDGKRLHDLYRHTTKLIK